MLSRHCDVCSKPITTKYYDLMINEKDASDTPDQDSQNSYGDFCIGCIKNGGAIKQLLNSLKAKKKS